MSSVTDGIKVEHHLGAEDQILADRLGALVFFGTKCALIWFLCIMASKMEDFGNEKSCYRYGK